MSKSIGNVVDPFDILEMYPLEAVKLYILVNGPLMKDSNFIEGDLEDQWNHFIDKIVNCYTRVFGKKMLKGCNFDQPIEKLIHSFENEYTDLVQILKQISDSIDTLNPEKT